MRHVSTRRAGPGSTSFFSSPVTWRISLSRSRSSSIVTSQPRRRACRVGNAVPRVGKRLPTAWILYTVATLIACFGSAGCQTGDIEVQALSISGNQHVATRDIEAVLATHASGRFPWSAKAFFNRQAFETDLGRIRRLYQDRGYGGMRFAKV